MFLRLLAPAYVLAAFLLCASQANAQTPDSAYFDLGRVKLLKSSTQHVTVKAEDLQKFPFANLSEAVNVWFSGYYSNTNTLVYVIDGNLATDVNQYPIYDIEEITLIQNAVAQLNGISQQQQLIVVTTKRNRSGNQGVTLAGQANLVKLQTNRLSSTVSTESDNAFYQQYHLSAYKNINQTHFGLSANYLHDAMPSTGLNLISSVVEPTIKRWRFNGYFNTSLWKGTVIDLTAGYAPQSDKQDLSTFIASGANTQAQIRGDENLFNGTLNLKSQLLPGLTNEVRLVYNNLDYDDAGNYVSTIRNGTNSETFLRKTSSSSKLKNIVVYDELRYVATSGNFSFLPAINFSYRRIKNASSNRIDISNSYTINTAELTNKTYLLTPTLGVSFKNALNITAGLVQILNSNYVPKTAAKKTFPFVTAWANVSKLIDTSMQANINVYGSYALSNLFNDSRSSLSNINAFNTSDYYTNQFASNSDIYNYVFGKTFKTLSLGLNAGLFHNKVELSYNYESRNSISLIYYYIPGSAPYTYSYAADTKYKSQRIGVAFNLLKQDNIKWRTQINVNNFKQQINPPSGNFIYPVSPLNTAWTGGWTNRLQYKSLTGGIDVQYLFGKNNFTQAAIQSLNSFALQNLYIGWQIKTAKAKSLEIFANGRNITQNKNSILPDYRRYVGLGVQATF